MSDNKTSFWTDLGAMPRAFTHGLAGGLLGPIIAAAGGVVLLYALTRQLPTIKPVTRRDGAEGKAIILASPTEARASWARYAGELRGTMLELRSRRQAR